MPVRRAAPLVLVLLAALCAPPPLASAASDEDPLMARGGGPEGGWVSVAYEIPPGGEAFLFLGAYDFAGPLHVMGTEYRANGSKVQSFDTWRWSGEDREPFVHAQPQDMPGASVHLEARAGSAQGAFFGMGFGQRNVFSSPLLKIWLLSATQQGGDHEWRLHGTPGVRIVKLLEGDATRMYRTADFVQGEGVAVVAPTAPGVVDVNAFHDASGRVGVQVEKRFYGFFGAGDATHACTGTAVGDDVCHDPDVRGTLAWSGPDGGAEGPAASLDVRFHEAPAGAYGFEMRDFSSLQATQGGPCVGPLWTCASLAGSEVMLVVIDAEPAIP